MNYKTLHSWDMTAEEARVQQAAMRPLVSLEDGFAALTDIKHIAGVDLSFNEEKNEGYAVVVVLSFPALEVVEARYATDALKMPYIPGLLSFRESPVALQAFAQIETIPDVIMLDGQGQAHPRQFGIACHLGVLLDVSAIGVAKSFLYGEYDQAAVGEAGDETPLWDRGRQHVLGTVMKTKPRTNPLYVSPGHKMSVASASRLVRECLRGYRLPEPTRQAHNLITAYKKTGTEGSLPSAPVPKTLTFPL